MNEWTKTTVGELAKRTGGSVKTGPFGTALKAAEYSTVGAPVVSTGEVGYSQIEIHAKTPRVTGDTLERLSAYLLEENDVVFARKGSIDRLARIRAKEAGYFLGSDALRLRLGDGVEPKFIAYHLQTPASRSWLIQHAGGSTMPSLNQRIIAEIPLSLPPLDEQFRIAAVLGAFDDLIETNRQIIDKVRNLSRSLYAALTLSVDQSVLLGDVARVSDMKTNPSTGKLRYIDIAAMGDGTIDLPDPIDWADAPSRARMKATDGSTLWSTVRPNRRAHGLLVESPEDVVVSTGIAVLRPEKIGPAELFAATDTETFIDQLVALAEGSAYPAVRPRVFKEQPILCLPRETSKRFENSMWPLWQEAQAAANENANLTRTRDELLPLLMSDRVRVEDVEAPKGSV